MAMTTGPGIRFSYISWPHEFILTEEGKLIVKNLETKTERIMPWYEEKGTPWIVRKRKSFIGLIKMGIREGDYDE